MSLPALGLGFRRPWYEDIKAYQGDAIGFFEVAPENWIKVGGYRREQLQFISQHYPLVAHGLSLSIGGFHPLDENFLADIKQFLTDFNIQVYSEHLSYCGDSGHLYNLLPIPFTEEAVLAVSKRIRHIQDVLERRIAIENISYYCAPGAEISELDFINGILQEADCDLLLDVNNVYVNSVNHHYDAAAFIAGLNIKAEQIPYLHIAGHRQQAPDLLIDTHGAPVITPVWQLLDNVYERFGVLPTLLERDNDIPSFHDILLELNMIKQAQLEVA